MTLKIRSRPPNFDHLFLPSHQCIYASLVKLHSLVQKISREAIFWTFQCTPVTLSTRSRSSKSNQIFHSSQQCTNASLVKIHYLVQNIMHGNKKWTSTPTPTHTGSAPKTIYPLPSGLGGHKYLQSPLTITILLAEENKETRIVRESIAPLQRFL